MKDPDFSLEWSAWKVWLHPKHSLDIMENFYLDGEKADLTIHNLSRERDMLSVENRKLSEGNQQLSLKVDSLSKELEETRASLEKTRESLYDTAARLKEQTEIDRMLADYERKLDGIIEMKKGYERKISELEARLRDLSGNSELETAPGFKPRKLDFTKGSQSELTEEPQAGTATDSGQDADWLLELPPL